MTLIPFIRRNYTTDISTVEIRKRVESRVVQPNNQITFNKVINNHILEGVTTEKGFTVVMGRYGLTYGKTSLLPYLIGNFKNSTDTQTRLNLIIQPSLGSGLLILGLVYLLSILIIYISWTKGQVQGVIVPTLLIVTTYLSLLLKFNKVKKVYLDFIENEILNNYR